MNENPPLHENPIFFGVQPFHTGRHFRGAPEDSSRFFSVEIDEEVGGFVDAHAV